MAKQGYRKILNSHGLRMKYDDCKKTGKASKDYSDGEEFGHIGVTRRKGHFSILVSGVGRWATYFRKEAWVLAKLLEPYALSLKIGDLVDER